MPSLAQGLYELLVTQLLEEQLRHPQLEGAPDVDERHQMRVSASMSERLCSSALGST